MRTIILICFNVMSISLLSSQIRLRDNWMYEPKEKLIESIKPMINNSVTIWGMNADEYIFEKKYLSIISDTLTKIIGIDKNDLENYYESWKENVIYPDTTDSGVFDYAQVYDTLNKYRNEHFLLFSSILLIPSNNGVYGVFVVDNFCYGLCLIGRIYVIEIRNDDETKYSAKVIYHKLIRVS